MWKVDTFFYGMHVRRTFSDISLEDVANYHRDMDIRYGTAGYSFIFSRDINYSEVVQDEDDYTAALLYDMRH